MGLTLQTDAGQLLATVQRTGGGRLPVRWRVYWSLLADRLGAPSLPLVDSRDAARAAVLTWASAQALLLRPAA